MKAIQSAGLVYFYLFGSPIEDNKIVLDAINSYQYFPDGFYKKVSNTISQNRSIKEGIHIFGVIGVSEKIENIGKIIHDSVADNFENLLQNKRLFEKNPLLDYTGNIFSRLVQDFFCECSNHKFEDKKRVNIYCLFGSDSKNIDAVQLYEQVLQIWLKKEFPTFIGRQIMLTSFYLQGLRGRKLLYTLPFGISNTWSLLFEGGKSVQLDSEFMQYSTFSDVQEVGYSITDLDGVLQNPKYALGKEYYPFENFLEWNKVFLYYCALYNDEFDLQFIKQLYKKFLHFIRNNICLVENIRPMITENEFYETLIARIKRFQDFLKGKDEEVVSKELLQVLKTRYIYLNYMRELFGKKESKSQKFSQKEMQSKLKNALEAKNAFDKGKYWEKTAEYYLQHIEGLKITAKRIRAGYQEIDISLVNISQNDVLWQLGAYILVECKNYSKHVSIREIRNIAYVCNMKGCRTALLFTVNGITLPAEKEILRLASTGMTVLCFCKEELSYLKNNNDCLELLVSKWNAVQAKSEFKLGF